MDMSVFMWVFMWKKNLIRELKFNKFLGYDNVNMLYYFVCL